jgi:hypothetical protein
MKKSSPNYSTNKNHFRPENNSTGTWWASGDIIWWIGILFAIGSTLFALGSVEGYIYGRYSEGFEFFIGSLFFTAAALLQYIHTVKVHYHIKENSRFYSGLPQWAILVQLLGTLFFNVSTYVALKNNLMVTSLKNQVWSPDFFGSMCFLIATGLVWLNVGQVFRNQKGVSCWAATFNLVGSMAFVFSAFTAYIMPKTGIPHSEILMNTETFLGSICFLIGAVLLIIGRKSS